MPTPVTILIVSHAPIGSALLSALRDILPSHLTEHIIAFDIQINDNPEKKTLEALNLLTSHSKEKLLILSDLIGATPYNIARQIMLNTHHVECALITGISLPMLVKAVSYQHLSLEKWVAELTDSALEWLIIEFKRKHSS